MPQLQSSPNQPDSQFTQTTIPIWKLLIIARSFEVISIGVAFSFKGYFIEVLSILSILFFIIGIFFFFIFLTSKELFLWIVGKRSEYEKTLKASQSVSVSLGELAIDTIPMELTDKEKESLKKDIPTFVQMRFMQSINDVIIRFFIGTFAAAFGLLGTIVLMNQNKKIDSQNIKLDVQNEKVNIQNNLMEAERRSSLIFLMSNILDKVDNEIRDQRSNEIQLNKVKLSKLLIGRIIALSRAFRPYKVLEGDSLKNQLISPERGQLFIAIMQAGLDSLTQNIIVEQGDFSKAIVGKLKLENSNLIKSNFNGADFSGVDMKDSKLNGADFRNAILKDANFRNCDFRTYKEQLIHKYTETDFSNADLTSVNFTNANLEKVKLDNAILKGARLINAKFNGAKLDNASLNNASLNGSNFSGASMSNVDFKGALMTLMHISFNDGHGVFKPTIFKGTSLKDSDFESTNLEYVDFSGASLENVNFNNANLEGVNFTGSKGLTAIQLLKAMNLRDVQGLEQEVKNKLMKDKPCLFLKASCN